MIDRAKSKPRRICPILGADAVSVARLEERLVAMHATIDRIDATTTAQNGRLRAVEEAQAEAKGAGKLRERISNLVSAIVGGVVVAAASLGLKQWLGG